MRQRNDVREAEEGKPSLLAFEHKTPLGSFHVFTLNVTQY